MVQFTVDLRVWRHYKCHHDHKFCALHMQEEVLHLSRNVISLKEDL
jgi:hypothetical protein